jgi:hypothetical protein
MRRIISMVTLALVVAALVVAMAMPAFARNYGNQPPGPPYYSSSTGSTDAKTWVAHCNADPTLKGAEVSNQNYDKLGYRGRPSAREVC